MTLRLISGLFLTVLWAMFVGISPVKANSDFAISLDNDKTLSVSYKGTKLQLNAGAAWKSDGKAAPTYTYSGPVTIDKLTLGEIDASVGPDGVVFTGSAGFTFGGLTLSSGEMTFELTSGDKIVNGPELAKFGSDDFVLFASVNNEIDLDIDGATQIALPGTGNVNASLVVEFKNGSLYYEGPIPAPTVLAGGLNKMITAASGGSGSSNILTGGFGFSLNNAFSYESDVELYSSSGDPAKESFGANVILVGAFDLLDSLSVDGTLMLDLKNGKAGMNGPVSASLGLFGASASLQLSDTSMVADSSGVRFASETGLNGGSVNFPSSLKPIEMFMSPLLDYETKMDGYVKPNGSFSFAAQTSDLMVGPIPFKDAVLELTSSGLDVGAKVITGGLGNIALNGVLTNEECSLSADNLKVFGFNLGSPKVNPCAEIDGDALPFTGTINILGQSLKTAGQVSFDDAKSGTMDVLDALSFDIAGLTMNVEKVAAKSGQEGVSIIKANLGAFSDFIFDELPIGADGKLSKNISTKQSYSYKKKAGISGLGYVKLSGAGDVNLTLKANGTNIELASAIDMTSSAKFCVGTKIGGHKIKKCKKTSTNVNTNFDVSTGCFKIGGGATVKVLGKNVSYPDQVCFKDDDDVDGKDESAFDEVGVAMALKAPNGKYVQWQNPAFADPMLTSNTINKQITFTMAKTDATNCIQEGDLVALRAGDVDSVTDDHFVRQKNHGGHLDVSAGHVDDQKERFYISFVKMGGECIGDGDQIRLKNKEHKQYWTRQSNNNIEGHSDPVDTYTVVFDPQ